MSINGRRAHRNQRTRKRAGRSHNESSGVTGGLAPEEMLVYNATLDATLELLNTALSSASRFQQLQGERGKQALSLAGSAVSVFSEAGRDALFTAQADLTQEAMDKALLLAADVHALGRRMPRAAARARPAMEVHRYAPAWALASLGADEDAERWLHCSDGANTVQPLTTLEALRRQLAVLAAVEESEAPFGSCGLNLGHGSVVRRDGLERRARALRVTPPESERARVRLPHREIPVAPWWDLSLGANRRLSDRRGGTRDASQVKCRARQASLTNVSRGRRPRSFVAETV